MTAAEQIARQLQKTAARDRQVLAYSGRRWYAGCVVASAFGCNRVMVVDQDANGGSEVRMVWAPQWLTHRLSPASPKMDHALYLLQEKGDQLINGDRASHTARKLVRRAKGAPETPGAWLATAEEGLSRWAQLNTELKAVHLLEGEAWVRERPDRKRQMPPPSLG